MNKKERKAAKATVDSFMIAWMNRDWREMDDHCQKTWMSNHSIEELSALFDNYRLSRYRIASSVVSGEAVLDVLLLIDWHNGNGRIFKSEIIARTICETGPYSPSLSGSWGVNPISVLRRS